MSDLPQTDSEQLSRRQAAERLTDIAYALTAGGPLKLGDHEAAAPVGDQIALKLASTDADGEVELQVVLSWSTVTVPNQSV